MVHEHGSGLVFFTLFPNFMTTGSPE